MSIENERRKKFFASAYRMKSTAGFYVLLLSLTAIINFSEAKQAGEFNKINNPRKMYRFKSLISLKST